MKLKLLSLFLVLVLTALHASPSQAQLGVGASFTLQHITLDPTQTSSTGHWLYGPTFSVQEERGHFLKLGLEARGSILRGDGVGVDAFDVGPRVAVSPRIVPIKPYGEILIGGMGVRPRTGSAFTTHIDLQYVVGVEYTILPHVDWRVVEYTYGRVFALDGLANEDIRNQLSTGLVLRLF